MSTIRIIVLGMMFAAMTFVPFLAPRLYAAPLNFYVDSINGADTNSGTSTNSPWKSLAKVNSYRFSPGATVFFKRGSSWTGQLIIRDSGVQGNVITFRDYGSGARPTISNPGAGTKVILVYGSWVVVQGFLVKDSGDVAVEIEVGANYNIIRDIEATNSGQGFSVSGQYNLITNNYAHDLNMIVNTPGGNDDYGALGYLIMNSDNEVSYNSCINCRAPSYDWGTDGGVVEIYSNGDNSYIHNNYGRASDGFIEVGVGSARNVRVAYNVSDNNYTHFACLHTGGDFGSLIDNFRIENNTIVNSTATGWAVINCSEVPLTPSQVLFRNNIVYTNMLVTDQTGITHNNNSYYMAPGGQLGYALASGERIVDPQFVSLSAGDYRLQSLSTAINSGLNLGYALDYSNQSVPQGGVPDIGAYEFVMSAPLPPLRVSVFVPMISR